MEDRKPVIGITASADGGRLALGCGCERAVVAAGGIPLVLPVHIGSDDAEALLRRCDGVLFSGGADLDPVYYGENVLAACGGIDVDRDKAEAAYFAAARRLHLPIFGICRGHQVINALMGGTLYQDIVTQFPRENALQHRSAGAGDTLLHPICIEPGSRLEKIADGEPMRVTSTHHQAVRRIADGLRATGTSPDGIIEVLEGTGEDFIMSVQFHPELRFEREGHALRLFRAFTDAARRYRETAE